jgi:hypothetical protein
MENCQTPAKNFICGTFTPTVTPTITGTPPTPTETPTITVTPTEVFDSLQLNDVMTYPNPSRGDTIKFRYSHTGYIDSVKIRVFTFSTRKIAEINETDKSSGDSETIWTPPSRLGNGLYYYIMEFSDKEKYTARKVGTFVVLRNLLN